MKMLTDLCTYISNRTFSYFGQNIVFKKRTHAHSLFQYIDHLSGLALTITQNNQAKRYDFHSRYKNSSFDNTPICLLRDFLSPYFPRFL